MLDKQAVAQEKLWQAVSLSAYPEEALPLLREARLEGATIDSTNTDGHDPLRAVVEVCCLGKHEMAGELAMLGCNPLNESLAWAIDEEDIPISLALVDACLARNYQSDEGRGLMESILLATPVNMLETIARYAIEHNADMTPPQGRNWFHVLLDNEQLFRHRKADQFAKDETYVGWELATLLFATGHTDDGAAWQGKTVAERFAEKAALGCDPPQDPALLDALINGTPYVKGPAARSTGPRP